MGGLRERWGRWDGWAREVGGWRRNAIATMLRCYFQNAPTKLGAAIELFGASLALLGATFELLGATLELLGDALELRGWEDRTYQGI